MSDQAATTMNHNDFISTISLAETMRCSASYLRHCANKHGVTGPSAALSARAIKACDSIAQDMERIDESNPALARYRHAILDLDATQLEAFALIRIDYQARIGREFSAVSTNHYLAAMTAIAFALAAIKDPACLGGVGGGFSPRHR